MGGLGAEPPVAGAIGDLRAKLPAAGDWGSGGKVSSRRRQGGLDMAVGAQNDLGGQQTFARKMI